MLWTAGQHGESSASGRLVQYTDNNKETAKEVSVNFACNIFCLSSVFRGHVIYDLMARNVDWPVHSLDLTSKEMQLKSAEKKAGW